MKITGLNFFKDCIIHGYPFIESVLSALPFCDEYLVNDGGSTDGTLEALENLADTYSKVKVSRIPDIPNIRWDSCSIQSNTMIGYARGDWIFLGNADEFVHEDDVSMIKEYVDSRTVWDTMRFNRREVIRNWSDISDEVYHPGRFARKKWNLRMDWNAYGGDEFLYGAAWDDPSRLNVMPFTLYHIYNMFPRNYMEKLRNDAEYISPGDKMRVNTYNRMKGSVIPETQVKKIYPYLPALARGLVGLKEYIVRPELYSPEFLEMETGLKY